MGRHRAVNRVRVNVPEGGRSYKQPVRVRDNARVRAQKAQVTAAVRKVTKAGDFTAVKYVSTMLGGRLQKVARTVQVPPRRAKATTASAHRFLTGLSGGKSSQVKTTFGGKKVRVR